MIIKNGEVFYNNEVFIKRDILVEGRIIKDIKEVLVPLEDTELNASDCYVVPGFIDIHTHGANGSDIMNSTFENLDDMSRFYASKGVTGFLAATVTSSCEEINSALRNTSEAIKRGTSGAKILGIHLEGPFINPKNRGAQPLEHIKEPTIEEIERFIESSGNNIKIITLAPEMKETERILKHFSEAGIVFSAGHSSANYNEAITAFKNGVSHITHLFNGMTELNHREPGIALAALDSEKVTVEIIADGIHVHPSLIRMALKCKGPENIALITDSIEAAGLGEGKYRLGGQKIIVKKNEARLESGTLAGSTITMIEAVQNMVERFHIPLEDTLKMAASTPARIIGMRSRKGSISRGKDADVVIIDKNFQVKYTLVEGQIVYAGH